MWFWQGFTPFLALTLQLNSVYFNFFSSLSTSMAWSSSCSLIPISLFWWSMPSLMELWGWNAELFQMSGICVYLRINGQKGNHKLRFTGSSVLPFSTPFLGWFLRNNMEQKGSEWLLVKSRCLLHPESERTSAGLLLWPIQTPAGACESLCALIHFKQCVVQWL